MKKRFYESLYIRVEPDMRKRLNQMAAKRRISTAEVCREALWSFLDGDVCTPLEGSDLDGLIVDLSGWE